MAKEASIHHQVAQYLKMQYPKVIFRTDYAAGLHLTMNQAVRHKSLQSGRAYPDIFIAQPMTKQIAPESVVMYKDYCGLYIELKQEKTVLIRPKDAKQILKGETKLRLAGDWFDDHIEEQARMLIRLRDLGYVAEFARGFDEARCIIDNYLKS